MSGSRGWETDKRASFYSLDRWLRHARRYRGFHEPSVELHLNLIYTYGVVASHFARRLSAKRLSLSAGNVLMILRESENKGRPLHEIGELLLVSRANITALVDSLERRGLLERVGQEGDRRVRIARITKAGEALLESILPGHYAEIRRIYTVMSSKEKILLSRLLTKLRNNVQRSIESDRERGENT
ncbi:MAG: MarR family transcriptional regulator [Acidobacteria bacterium]|nr:MarR family transcriptional regulator [Acidobacteriota bacterium]